MDVYCKTFLRLIPDSTPPNELQELPSAGPALASAFASHLILLGVS